MNYRLVAWADLAQGTFLRNHYHEALTVISDLEPELAVLRTELNVSDLDFKRYIVEEREFLAGLKEPSPTVTLTIEYIKALMELSRHA